MCPALPQCVAARPVLLGSGSGRARHGAGHHGEEQDGGDGGGQSRISKIYPATIRKHG